MDDVIHEQYPYDQELRNLFLLKPGVNTVYSKDKQAYKARRLAFGWVRANPLVQRPKPSLTKPSAEYPTVYEALVRTAEDIYRKYADSFIVGEPQHTMGESIFTGCVVNYSSAMRPHNDSGNVAGSKSAMVIMKAPGCYGGALKITETGEEINFKDGDILIFDGGKHEHCVTPIKGSRVSIVFYTNKGL
jgi:hypothetical protein